MTPILDHLATGLAEGRSRREAIRMAFGIGASATVVPLFHPDKSFGATGKRITRLRPGQSVGATRKTEATKPTLICSSPAPPEPMTCPPDASFPWYGNLNDQGCGEGVGYSTGASSTYNGCGPEGGVFGSGVDAIPDQPGDLANFYPACAGHDCCYGTCGAAKDGCDSAFFGAMLAICDSTYPAAARATSTVVAAEWLECYGVAQVYYDGVDQGGQDAYNAAQSEDCACCCPDGKKYCGDGHCFDLQTDPNNCGACGNVCPDGAACSGGQCDCGSGPPCTGGLSCCSGVCTDLSSSPADCGSCGNECPPTWSCVNAVCQECPKGETKCAEGCTDLMTDALNCGSCGNACPAGEECTGGQCTCHGSQCSGNDTCCSNICTDLQTDPSNCGACGNVCSSGDTCCSGSCVDLQTDPNNCGACGNVCPGGDTCCSGACVDLNSDPMNCGACGNACS